MNQTEVLKIMQTEKECVERQGTVACPNRDCENCDLLLPTEKVLEAYDVAIKVLERGWIPLTTRPMTEDEKQHYIDIEKPEVAECGEILACPLPDDGQEVLISEGGIVYIDTFYHDDDCYFENADIDDVDAWMSLPDCYQPEEVRQQIKDFADQLYDSENVKMMISLDDFKDITKKSIDSADTIKGILLNMCNGLYKKGIENAKETSEYVFCNECEERYTCSDAGGRDGCEFGRRSE